MNLRIGDLDDNCLFYKVSKTNNKLIAKFNAQARGSLDQLLKFEKSVDRSLLKLNIESIHAVVSAISNLEVRLQPCHRQKMLRRLIDDAMQATEYTGAAFDHDRYVEQFDEAYQLLWKIYRKVKVRRPNDYWAKKCRKAVQQWKNMCYQADGGAEVSHRKINALKRKISDIEKFINL